MLLKLEKLKERLDEIQNALLDSDTVKDIEKYTQLNKEFSELRPIVEKFDEYNETIIRYEGATSLLESEDDEIKELAQIELEESQPKPKIDKSLLSNPKSKASFLL
jgi:peptide chain release factor 1